MGKKSFPDRAMPSFCQQYDATYSGPVTYIRTLATTYSASRGRMTARFKKMFSRDVRIEDCSVLARSNPAILALALRNPPGRKDLRKAYFLGQGPPLWLKLSGYIADSNLQELTGHTLFRVR